MTIERRLPHSIPFASQKNSESPIDVLPEELCTAILEWLDPKTTQTVVRLNKNWNVKVVTSARYKQIRLINELAKFLKEAVPLILNRVETRQNLDSILKATSLKAISDTSLTIKRNLLNSVAEGQKENLIQLREVALHKHQPLFFEDLFDLALICQAIKETNTLINSLERGKKFTAIFNPMLELKNSKVALEMSALIAQSKDKDKILKIISEKLLEQKNNHQALEVATCITEEYWREEAISNVALILIQQNEIDRALEVTNKLSPKKKESTTKEICEKLVQKKNMNHINKAIEISINLSNLNRKFVLVEACEELTIQGYSKKAIEITRTMKIAYHRDDSFKKISKQLALQGWIDESIAVADEIDNINTKNRVYFDNALIFAEQRKFDEAIELAGKLTTTTTKNSAFSGIQRIIDQKGDPFRISWARLFRYFNTLPF